MGGALIGKLGHEGAFKVLGPFATCDSVTPSSVVIDGPQGERLEFETAPVDISSEPRIDASRFSMTIDVLAARVVFTPTSPGMWTITVVWTSGAVSTQDVLATVHADPVMTFRQYVDAMHDCDRGPFRTLGGMVLCQRGVTISAYRIDGSLDHTFHGNELAVLGNEVWSNRGDALEHRSDVQGQLVLDGSIATGPSTGIDAETRRGVAFRYVVPDAGAGSILEARWDGMLLTSVLHPAAPPFSARYRLVFEPTTGSVWGTDQQTCMYAPDCQSWSCVGPCLEPLVSGVSQFGDPDALWKVDALTARHIRVAAARRPLRDGEPAIHLLIRGGATDFNKTPAFERPRFAMGNTIVTPQLVAGEIQLSTFEIDGALLTITDDWVISLKSDFVLNFAPTPPR